MLTCAALLQLLLLLPLCVSASDAGASPSPTISTLMNGVAVPASAFNGGNAALFSFAVDRVVVSQKFAISVPQSSGDIAIYAQINNVPTPKQFMWNKNSSTDEWGTTLHIAPDSPGFTIGTLYIAYGLSVSFSITTSKFRNKNAFSSNRVYANDKNIQPCKFFILVKSGQIGALCLFFSLLLSNSYQKRSFSPPPALI